MRSLPFYLYMLLLSLWLAHFHFSLSKKFRICFHLTRSNNLTRIRSWRGTHFPCYVCPLRINPGLGVHIVVWLAGRSVSLEDQTKLNTNNSTSSRLDPVQTGRFLAFWPKGAKPCVVLVTSCTFRDRMHGFCPRGANQIW